MNRGRWRSTSTSRGAKGTRRTCRSWPSRSTVPPPARTLAVEADLPEQDEYEVRVFEAERRRLVAAVEIVSPANKDRPEHRRAFVAKCAALLQQGVSVSVVDLVTARRANLYADVLELLGQVDPSLGGAPPSLSAVEFRWHRQDPSWRLETWA